MSSAKVHLGAHFPTIAFATPRKLPRPAELTGRVAVVDVAFASEASGGGYLGITKPFIDGLGERLAAWVDHHDHAEHAAYANDSRFLLRTKSEHGACPEMVTPEIVKRAGEIQTIVCHTDFDGLCSAAKWIRQGVEPYPGADDDARAVDTRIGKPSDTAVRFDRAIRAAGREYALLGIIVRHLAKGLEDVSLWEPIDRAAERMAKIEGETRKLAAKYRVLDCHKPLQGSGGKVFNRMAVLKVDDPSVRYDKTLLLLLGQERAGVALLVDRDTLTLAAGFDSGLNFLSLLGLSGGMPTLVSVNAKRYDEVASLIGLSEI